jgi:hypothetical protein
MRIYQQDTLVASPRGGIFRFFGIGDDDDDEVRVYNLKCGFKLGIHVSSSTDIAFASIFFEFIESNV